jgi:hypothetical protein
VAIKKNTYTGESRGFAFVNFFSVDGKLSFIQMLARPRKL